MRNGTFSNKQGAIGNDKEFAIFPSYDIGSQALGSLLGGSFYQSLTIDQAIATYAPSNENNTQLYQKNVGNALNLSGQTPMSTLSSSQMGTLENAIANQEGYTPGTTGIQVIQFGP
ncbi:MAG: hypothetical protein ACRD4O_17020 [Bryobacteraceae bacterium]